MFKVLVLITLAISISCKIYEIPIDRIDTPTERNTKALMFKMFSQMGDKASDLVNIIKQKFLSIDDKSSVDEYFDNFKSLQSRFNSFSHINNTLPEII